MSKKELTLEEKELLLYCLKKYKPELIDKLDQLYSGMLDFKTISLIRDTVGDALFFEGIEDSQVTKYGMKLEDLIDRLADLYLWPAERKEMTK